MHKIKIGAVGIGIVGMVLIAGAATSATNASHHAGPSIVPGTQHKAAPMIVAPNERLKTTEIESDFSGASLTAGGFTPVDAVSTIKCPGTTTCSMAVEMNIQAIADSTGDEWALCAQVDGNYLTCPFQGILPSDFFQVGSNTESITGLAPGNHTVQTFVYSSGTGSIYNYDIDYELYKK